MDGKEPAPAERWTQETVMVTGAARRIGFHLVQALLEAGAKVVAHFRHNSSQLQALCEQQPSRVVGLQADLSVATERRALIEGAWKAFGHLTGLVNCASVYEATPVDRMDWDRWHETLEVNLTAPAHLSLEIGLRMKARGQGAIVMIGDWSTQRPYPGYLAYTVSKGALETLTLSLARELAPQVRVNMAALGPILLPEGSSEEYRNRVAAAVPLGRTGTPEELARCVLHLLVEGTYTTGAVVQIDGGRHLR